MKVRIIGTPDADSDAAVVWCKKCGKRKVTK
jgi:hypothetical protein